MLTILWLLLAVVAFGALTFMPASADSLDKQASAPAQMVAVANAAETPQHLVWDMTYGDQDPMPTTEVAADESAVTAENKDVVDLSVG